MYQAYIILELSPRGLNSSVYGLIEAEPFLLKTPESRSTDFKMFFVPILSERKAVGASSFHEGYLATFFSPLALCVGLHREPKAYLQMNHCCSFVQVFS